MTRLVSNLFAVNHLKVLSSQLYYFLSLLFRIRILVPASPGVPFRFVKCAIDQLVNWSESFQTQSKKLGSPARSYPGR